MNLRWVLPLLCFAYSCGSYRSTPVDAPAELRSHPPAPAHQQVAAESVEPATESMAVELAPPQLDAPDDVADIPTDARVTASGLAYRVLTAGTGQRHPQRTSQVRVHYTGWTTDGERFDSSVARGQPIVFPLSGVIPGWTQGVQMMVEGETRRLWIPESLAYQGRAGSPAGMLVFDVQLIEIVRF